MAISTTSLPLLQLGRLWRQPPGQVVCSLLNRLFEGQPAVFELLSQHAGQSFRLVARPIDAAMTIDHDGRLAVADAAVVPDVTLKIDTAGLWRLGWRPGQPLPDRSGLVHVSGDAAMAQTLSTLAKSWRPDVEDMLSHYIGDLAAMQVVGLTKQLSGLTAKFVSRSSQNAAEYLAYEANLLVPDVPMRQQAQELRALSVSLDSLESRLQRLDARVAQLSDDVRRGQTS